MESDSDDGLVGFRPAPSAPKLNIDVIESKKSTTFIQNFNQYTERIRVENYVYTAFIGRNINLNAFHEATADTYGSQLNPKKFAALVMRWRDPRIALLLFSCGKIVCSGAKNKYQARIVIRDTIEIVRKLGYTDVDASKVKGMLQNMVSSVKLKFAVDLDEMAAARPDICKYQKDIFPGASLKIPKLGRINVSVYSAGRLIITGAKEIRDVKRAINASMPIITKHMRPATLDPIAKINLKSKTDDTFTRNLDINYQVEVEKKRRMKEEDTKKTNEAKRMKTSQQTTETQQRSDNNEQDTPSTKEQSEFKSNISIQEVPQSLLKFLPI